MGGRSAQVDDIELNYIISKKMDPKEPVEVFSGEFAAEIILSRILFQRIAGDVRPTARQIWVEYRGQPVPLKVVRSRRSHPGGILLRDPRWLLLHVLQRQIRAQPPGSTASRSARSPWRRWPRPRD